MYIYYYRLFSRQSATSEGEPWSSGIEGNCELFRSGEALPIAVFAQLASYPFE